jgi:hypothetical protein
MIYLLEFFGLLLVAIALAASPLLIRLFEYLLPRRHGSAPSLAPSRASIPSGSKESSELREEIRRLADVLEMDNRAPRG